MMIRKIQLTFALFCFLSIAANAQTAEPNVIDKSLKGVKMLDAHQDFLRGEIDKAMKTYNGLIKEFPNDADINYRLGECYLTLNNVETALEYLEKAKSANPLVDPEMDLLIGQAYQRTGNIDKAISAYEAFKKSLDNNQSKITDSSVDVYLSQCRTAKDLMQKPVDVVVENMGEYINSAEADKNPSVTADGKTLIFSSRRPTKGQKSSLDVEGDHKYFEDIYMVTYDEKTNSWGQAQPIPGTINIEDEHEACASISPDGKRIFVYKNNKSKARGGDIFVSKQSSSGKWSTPTTLGKPINTSYYEDGACLSPDGNLLYFISEYPKGSQGLADIWVAKKVSKTEWGIPENLGPVVNTPENEVGIFIAPDGKTLFFCSEGHGSMGGFDIFRTTLENGKWTKPVNIGYPINSINNDIKFVLSADAKTAYFASDRLYWGADKKASVGDRDLYKVDLKEYAVLEKDFKRSNDNVLSILKGDVFNAQAGEAMQADITILDENGQRVASTTSGEGGDYFLTLQGGKTYEIKVEVAGFKTINEKVDLKADKVNTFTLVKHFIMYK